jgi:hypothetical protein
LKEILKNKTDFTETALVLALLFSGRLKVSNPKIRKGIFGLLSKKDYHPLCGCGGKSYTFA